MQRGIIYTLFVVSLPLFVLACSGNKQIVYVQATDAECSSKQEEPPAWVKELPKDDAFLQAVGISGPTYYAEDAKKYAAENARAELARVLGVEVKSIMYMWQREHGVQDVETRVETMSLSFSDEVLHGSEIVAYWVDRCGTVSRGVKGTTYAWARMPKDMSKIKALAQKALGAGDSTKTRQEQPKRKAIDDVRQNSDKAFEELEREEQKPNDR